MENKKDRENYMSATQKALWKAREELEGRQIPRTHENCLSILGVARPGKTNKDKASVV